ncbi:hypothetical protein OG594_46120 [Streptomyces sp. NBC_01214]|uniref:hypothetical protein n=1 Tax=Streptomyces sp. NBC_01214 TaxID=2903777 RepID=UPI00225B51C1|nr:hypothetical protein [Streptomyces sp. NBC_01214]MCX4808840.1 hypothetical protein [Streptomyces sp. NBC_01214]
MSAHPASPNTVLANALTYAEDVLTPRIRAQAPQRVVFTVGTQINGAPHIGTSLVQSLTFAAAARVRDRFDLPVSIVFGALDNAPHEIATDPTSGHRYQRAYAQALGEDEIRGQVEKVYGPLFEALSVLTGIGYEINTYSEQQRTETYRRTWLRILPRLDAARWWLAPSTGVPHVRVPCLEPGCGWAEKYAERTRVVIEGEDCAQVYAHCLHHGPYSGITTPSVGTYLDLATLYRNLVKELSAAGDPSTLHVMVKGGDWVFGSHLVDGALQALGLAQGPTPARLFCPQIVTDTGAKLSKSLIREGRATLPEGAEPWMLDTRNWPGSLTEYAERLLTLSDVLFADPRHFFRSYSAAEIGRMMTTTTGSRTPA